MFGMVRGQCISSDGHISVHPSTLMLGIGCLKWAHSWGYLLLNSMTLPVLTLFLALPVRLYVITLVIPFVGTLAVRCAPH